MYTGGEDQKAVHRTMLVAIASEVDDITFFVVQSCTLPHVLISMKLYLPWWMVHCMLSSIWCSSCMC